MNYQKKHLIILLCAMFLLVCALNVTLIVSTAKTDIYASSTTQTEAVTETETAPGAESSSEESSETGGSTETESETSTETASETSTETESETSTETASEASTETGSETNTEAISGTETNSETGTGTESGSEAGGSETPSLPTVPQPDVLADSNAVPLSGLQKIDGSIYFYEDGVPFTNGLKKIRVKGKKYYYYFDKDGTAITKQWITIHNKQYYFGKNGRAYTGYHTISHYYCKFSSTGVLLRKIDKKKKMVALTYDDGPSIYTPKLLKTLEKYDAVATFFVLGNRVSPYKDSIKKEYELGCEIANHSYKHTMLHRASTDTIKSECKKTSAAIKKITGETPALLRPPGGNYNDTVKSTVNMPMIMWSIDTLDWKTRNASKTYSAVLDHVKDGDIVLMHDIHEPTVNASKKIIPALIKKGYQLVTVSELAACRGINLKKGSVYRSFRK